MILTLGTKAIVVSAGALPSAAVILALCVIVLALAMRGEP